mmetsp:Transcript_44352/g.50195  ORF Transcript_44352/g.50195 Transcript_44352/m.50195 type:complete len:1544 (-) Transcript_44352:65-4696(-)
MTEEKSTERSTENTGFFSLGDSNIMERARRLKQEKNPTTETNRTLEKSNGKKNDNTTDIANENITSFHEFDSLLISHQVDESNNALYNSLAEGFRSLGESRVNEASSSSPDAIGAATVDDGEKKVVNGKEKKYSDRPSAKKQKQLKYSASVNFIDPTTKMETVASSPKSSSSVATSFNTTKPTNMLQQQSILHRRDSDSSASSNSSPSAIENVYENLTSIFEHDYGSTLRSVQYKNIRTGETNIISSLPVRPVITRHGSIGGTGSSSGTNEVNTPWGGSTAILPVSDSSEWHTGPFCHVYIAACESTVHYRTKIRPSLRAFVSQLESAPSNTSGNQQGGHSADYLIVYIPTGDGRAIATKKNTKESSAINSTTGKNNNTSGFFQKARQRFGGNSASQSQIDDDDVNSKDSMDSCDDVVDITVNPGLDGDDVDSGSVSITMTLQHLSRNERALYKKISLDFPNGKVCVLSTTSLVDRNDGSSDSEGGLAIRVQEWNAFNRILGIVIVNGFQDRCRRYKDELKRLDAQRATAATAAKNYESGGNISTKPQGRNPYSFNISHFFLVKESLASSYEQMQLPAEALLQYDEFRLYLPDLSDKEESKVRRARRKSKALIEDDLSQNLAKLADAGDFLGFRKKIRTEYDLTAILDIMRRYLFARELSLLFRMEQPVEILSRCQAFIKVIYSILLRGISALDKKDQQERKTSAARWVLQFSWDIYCCVTIYFNTSSFAEQPRQKEKGNIYFDDMLKTDWSTFKSETGRGDEKVASKLCEILEVSRLLLMQLGGNYLEYPNPISILRDRYPEDLQIPWPQWIPRKPEINEKKNSNDVTFCAPNTSVFENEIIKRQFLLDGDAMTSVDKFEATYLKLCGAIIDTSHIANHHRFAARIQAEVGEYHARKGHFRSAVASFQKIVKIYRIDHWDRCHFWIVFRLAYCQRMISEPAAYLKTLCSCFSPRSALVAPKQALNALFDDLQKVIKHPTIGNARYSRLLFIEISLSILIPPDESQFGRILDQKQVEKRSCSVGESVHIPISIKSHLPGSIELSSVKLFAITRDEFTTILANGDAVQEEDAAKVLSLNVPVKLNPGENNFTFKWSPSSAGQYILSTVEIVWEKGYFYYDSMDLQEPLLSIEVLPSEPTHSISLKPATLIPGHDQEIHIKFEAGSDFVTSGTLILSGTNGISLIPPGEDPGSSEWRKECEIELNACKPGEIQHMTAHVRCGLIENFSNESISQVDSMNSGHGLVAKMQTTYLHTHTEDCSNSNPPCMKADLESFTPVLEKMALSVESVETYWLDHYERFVLSILLTSNTPYHFSVDEWEVQLASPITIATESLNDNLLKRTVSDGDHLYFAFECVVGKDSDNEPDLLQETKMNLKLCDDAGKVFSLELPLDLDEFYSRLSQLKSPKTIGTIPVILKLENNRGLVGEPLAMTFTVDSPDNVISNTATNFEGIGLAYTIVCEESEWLVGGKINGTIEISESNSFLCEIICIPVLVGFLNRFPTISLKLLTLSGSSITFNIECQNPEVFQSMPKNKVIGIASPSSKK